MGFLWVQSPKDECEVCERRRGGFRRVEISVLQQERSVVSFSQGTLCPPSSGVPFLREEYFVFVLLDCRTVQPCTASRRRRYVSNRHTGICFLVCCAVRFLEVIVYSVCSYTWLSRSPCHLTLLSLCLFFIFMNVCSIWWRPRRPSRVWRAPTSSSTV